MYTVKRIEDKTEVVFLWSSVQKWVHEAIAKNPLVNDVNDILHGILCGNFNLWVIYGDGVLVSAVVTELLSGGLGRSLFVITCGGLGLYKWLDQLLIELEKFARESRCSSIVEVGRPGWKRVLDKRGWVEYATAMLKVL